jgi:hypothetical protein
MPIAVATASSKLIAHRILTNLAMCASYTVLRAGVNRIVAGHE